MTPSTAPTASEPRTGPSYLVARQPIFDGARRLVGYELLYRDDAGATSAPSHVASADMTRRTLVSAILDIGLDQLTGPHAAWINFPRELLLDGSVDLLDPARVVIEILESVTVDAETVAACRTLRARGFVLALDDFVGGAEYEPLLDLVQVVKLDVLGVSPADLKQRVARVKRDGLRLLAERVEDEATFQLCRQLGFHHFQGYHFKRPKSVHRRALPTSLGRIASLMALVADPKVADWQLEEELRADPGLSVRLLRIVNNASTGHRNVESIRHALQLAGRNSVQRWLAMLLVSSAPMNNDVDREIVLRALEQGRFCESLGQRAGRPEHADSLFLVGLLAPLPDLLGVPMEDLLKQLGLSADVGAALRGEPGPHTAYLEFSNAFAAADWPTVETMGTALGVLDECPELLLKAGAWARGVLTPS